MWEKIKGWINVRVGVSELVTSRLRDYRVPKDAGVASTLGFVALMSLVVQAVTGVLLMMHYVPESRQAFGSVQGLMSDVPYGWLFRSVHLVGSNVLIAVLFLHTIYVFSKGSFSRPREITWFTGALMFLLTLLFSATGNLLPWTQLSYWSTTVMTSIPSIIPVVGEGISNFFKGGEFVSGTTLTRFFALHVAFLPFIGLILVGLHVFLVYRIGFAPSGGRGSQADESFRTEEHPDGQQYFSGFFLKGMCMFMAAYAVVFFVIAFMPTLLMTESSIIEANPLLTPDVIRPQWYFLAPYQMIKLIPSEFLGINTQILFVLAFIFWPFFDAQAGGRPLTKRPYLLFFFIAALVLWVILTFSGGY